MTRIVNLSGLKQGIQRIREKGSAGFADDEAGDDRDRDSGPDHPDLPDRGDGGQDFPSHKGTS